MKLFYSFFVFSALFVCCSVNSHAQNCNAQFTFTVNQSQVSFSATANQPGLFHSWIFGDGGYASYSLSGNATHTYTQSGAYLVKHFVWDSLTQCADSAAMMVAVTVTPSCNVNFTYIRPSITSGLYLFYPQLQLAGTTLQSVSWKINNTVVSANDQFSWTFSQAGVYTVCLTMITASGCTAEQCHTINYTPYSACELNADFTATPDPVQTRTVHFTAAPTGAPLSYDWRLPNQPGVHYWSTQPQWTNTFPAAGTYPVKLYVRDSIAGCYDSVVKNITITAPPSETCTGSVSYTSVSGQPGNLLFSLQSNQPVVNWNWTINPYSGGTLFTSQLPQPVYNLSQPGYYQVCVTMQTQTGCVRTICDSLQLSYSGRLAENNRVTLFPNPVNDQAGFDLVLKENAQVSVRVINLSGYEVMTRLFAGQAGANRFSLPLAGLTRGQYFLLISYPQGQKRGVFQKM